MKREFSDWVIHKLILSKPCEMTNFKKLSFNKINKVKKNLQLILSNEGKLLSINDNMSELYSNIQNAICST